MLSNRVHTAACETFVPDASSVAVIGEGPLNSRRMNLVKPFGLETFKRRPSNYFPHVPKGHHTLLASMNNPQLSLI